jgi:hypothetical protein
MPSLAEMLGYLVQPLGGPTIPILPKAASNATGGSIPGVPGPKGEPLSSPAELLAALTGIRNAGTAEATAKSEADLRKAQIEELGRLAKLREQLPGAFDAALAAMGGGGTGGQASGRLSFDELTGLAKNAGFSDDKAVLMAAISMGESGGNPNAYNGRGENSYGLTQINADAHGPVAREALNPQRAMELAFDISKGGADFTPWTVYKSGAYKQYLPAGGAAPMSLAPSGAAPAGMIPGGGAQLSPAQLAIARLGMLGRMTKMGDIADPLEKAFYNSPAFKAAVTSAEKGAGFPYETAIEKFKADLAERGKGRAYDATGAAVPVPGFDEVNAATEGAVAGARAAATSPIEMARDRFAAQLRAVENANRNIELAPNQRAFINPSRVPFPEVPGLPGAPSGAAPGPQSALAPGGAAPGGGMTLEGADSAKIKFGEDLAGVMTKDFGARRTAALDAGKSLMSAQEARKLLDSGIVTGFGADFLLNLGRALSQAGLSDGETVANTQAFVASRALEVGRIISLFGAGTGLSDADREFAIKASAGQIAMDEKSIRRILDINERASRNVIKQFNADAAKVDPSLSPFPLTVPEPSEAGRSGVTSGGVRWSRD